MGHKVNPISFRLGIVKKWKSRWFDRKRYSIFLEQDYQIRKFIKEKFSKSAIESVDINRSGDTVTIIIKTARPGLVIGRGGKGLEELQKNIKLLLAKLAGKRIESFKTIPKLEIEEIRKPESYASLVAQNIAEQLERRFSFRRAMKQTLDKVMQQKDVEGVKISLAGRLGGAAIARTEHLSRGRVPLQTLRANIDYAHVDAHTNYGVVGVKIWIYKGEVFDTENEK